MLKSVKLGYGPLQAIAISPIQGDWPKLEDICKSLDFLSEYYQINYIDSLQWLGQAKTINSYVQLFKTDIQDLIKQADLVLGFSFGGSLLQYLLPNLSNTKAKIILLSSPTVIDQELNQKISRIRELLLADKINEAVNYLNSFIFKDYKNSNKNILNQQAINRLLEGFRLILEVDARSSIESSVKPHLHLCGDESLLVNINHIKINKTSSIISIPNAKMRVLQDNPQYCETIIKNYLGINHEK